MNRIKRFGVLAFLFLASSLFGQVAVAPYVTSQPQFLDNNGNPLAAGCVFTYAAGTATPQATYTDSTGSVQNANPIILNAGGFPASGIWLSNLAYKFVVKSFGGSSCASGSTVRTEDNITQGNFLNAVTIAGTQTITGNKTFTGTTTAANLQGTLYPAQCAVSPAPSWCAGSEMGAWVNAAYAALPANGGHIHISKGTWTVTTSMVFGVAGKCPLITGDSRISTSLLSTATTGTLMTFDCYAWAAGNGVGAGISGGFGLRDIRLAGPGLIGGASGTSIGVQLGLTSSANGAAGWLGSSIDLTGFNVNLTFGMNTWAFKCEYCNFDLPGTSNFTAPNGNNSGESITFVAPQFGNGLSGNGAYKTNCVVISTGALISLIGGSLDNCQLVVNGGSPIVDLYGVNSENPLATNNTNAYVVVSAGTVSYYGGTMLQDSGTGSVPTSFASVTTGGALSLNGVWASNFSATLMYLASVSGSGTFAEYGTVASSGNMQAQVYTGSTAGGSISTLNKGAIVLSSTWQATGGVFAHAGSTTLTPQSLGGAFTATLPANTGNIEEINCSASQVTETGAATVLTCTPPSIAGSYRLRFVMSVSAANAATLGWTATWTDSNGTAQTPTNLSLFQSGTAAPALTFTTSAAGNYYGYADIDINNAGTNILIKTTFAGTSFTAKASATVERLTY